MVPLQVLQTTPAICLKSIPSLLMKSPRNSVQPVPIPILLHSSFLCNVAMVASNMQADLKPHWDAIDTCLPLEGRSVIYPEAMLLTSACWKFDTEKNAGNTGCAARSTVEMRSPSMRLSSCRCQPCSDDDVFLTEK